ncbi:molybdopterin molybdotransferase MoeA [Hyphobacterium marinum]|uniref:Molybdopterin molybdenumtransferase n=1 Tax=Hyphobacterium marinum TaxID=3116574 RepID=A0ABU7LU81_9PROT|nr:gephyrin-like molybdotransferase Glp [Hyphobacterium sp. Y6023]MEE2565103.1 gephyrin-like molybdotransferase Glp [Hyphobacterium sp. Y6023]
MLTLDEALLRIRDGLSALPYETVPVGEAGGRYLAAPVVAARTQPPFDASAMDGYAVRSADLTGASVTLRLAGESAAGHASKTMLEAGEAFRISTGAPMPAGADQVVIQENCARQDGQITTGQPGQPGAHIRRAGIDFTRGDRLLDAGQRISATAISLAASAGLADLTAIRQPRVGILSTGDELVEAGETARPDQIINSLAPGIARLVTEWGGLPRYLGIARDTPEDVRAGLAHTRDLDLLVTIGGASVGDHDHLRSVFAELGGTLVFEKIAIKPGKPTWFGHLDATPVIGLPGNPVSAMVMARLCLKPVLDSLLGVHDPAIFRTARLNAALPANGPRETMMRARIDPETGRIGPLVNQDSSALSALAASNALIRRPANAGAAKAGDTVEYLPLGPE